MSVYPLFLVLGSDGTIGAYAREDILKIDLEENRKRGQPARSVFKLNQHLMTVTYEPALEYLEFTQPLENLCNRHIRASLPLPISPVCVLCEAEQKAKGKSA